MNNWSPTPLKIEVPPSTTYGCAELDDLVRSEAGIRKEFRKGDALFYEGQVAHGIYCVLSGKIKLTKTGSEHREQIVRLARTGDVIGLRAAVTSEHYNASAYALDIAHVCFIPMAKIRALIDDKPGVAGSLMRLLGQALNEAEEKLVTMAGKPVRERVAETLLLLERVYNLNNGPDFSIAISREDLASLVGTAKETVIRFLSEFKHEGIISTKGSTVTIHDKERLLSISSLYD